MKKVTSKTLNKMIVAYLLERYAPLNFKKKSGLDSLYRWEGQAYTWLCPLTHPSWSKERSEECIEIIPSSQFGFMIPTQIYRHFMLDEDLLVKPESAGGIRLNYPYLSNGALTRLEFFPETSQEEFLNIIGSVFDKILARLAEIRKPTDVLAIYLNRNAHGSAEYDLAHWNDYTGILTGLNYAALYGPEHYLMLKKRHLPFFNQFDDTLDMKVRALKMIAYLDAVVAGTETPPA
ncbi:hypothetical protein [Allohahella marinimesophila]|uniref:Uncharacterized protein n=1 Tax=Allohahella marinimesophila TaxID=1054972 RepID=A0ABP7P5V4_9GAMM